MVRKILTILILVAFAQFSGAKNTQLRKANLDDATTLLSLHTKLSNLAPLQRHLEKWGTHLSLEQKIEITKVAISNSDFKATELCLHYFASNLDEYKKIILGFSRRSFTKLNWFYSKFYFMILEEKEKTPSLINVFNQGKSVFKRYIKKIPCRELKSLQKNLNNYTKRNYWPKSIWRLQDLEISHQFKNIEKQILKVNWYLFQVDQTLIASCQ